MKTAALAALALLSLAVNAQAAAPAVVQVQITCAETRAGFDFSPAQTLAPNSGPRNDLADAERQAAKGGFGLEETPIFSLTSPVGVTATVSTQTDYHFLMRKPRGGQEGGLVGISTLRSSLSITPRLNPDGTFSIRLALIDAHFAGLLPQGYGTPTTETISFPMIVYGKSGDTAFFEESGFHDANRRLYFATITLLPTPKG